MPRLFIRLFAVLLFLQHLGYILAKFQTHGQSWSSSPLTTISMYPNQEWQAMEDTSLSFNLTEGMEATVEFSLTARAFLSPSSTSAFLQTATIPQEFLQLRILIDGTPVPKSSQATSPPSLRNELTDTQLHGYFVFAFSAGAHTVQLQWRAVGTQTNLWYSSPNEGMYRSVLVSGEHKHIQEAPSSLPFRLPSSSSSSSWTPVSSMNVSLSSPAPTEEVCLFYSGSFFASPGRVSLLDGGSQGTVLAPSTIQDGLALRVLVNGLAYRECSASFYSPSLNPSLAPIASTCSLSLTPGNYTVTLETKRLGSVFDFWELNPTLLDGFASNLQFGLTVEYIHSFTISAQERTMLSYKSIEEQGWETVGGAVLNVNLLTASHVFITYSLPVSQVGNPNFDQWTWETWNQIDARIVVDGVAYRASSSQLEASDRSQKNLFGQLPLNLEAGSHSIKLQWQALSSSFSSSSKTTERTGEVSNATWMTLNAMEDGFINSDQLLVFVTPNNTVPSVLFSVIEGERTDTIISSNADGSISSIVGMEDETLTVPAIIIENVDSILFPFYELEVTVYTSFGSLHLPSDLVSAFQGTIVYSSEASIFLKSTIDELNTLLE
jgi:hypothetical protein